MVQVLFSVTFESVLIFLPLSPSLPFLLILKFVYRNSSYFPENMQDQYKEYSDTSPNSATANILEKTFILSSKEEPWLFQKQPFMSL